MTRILVYALAVAFIWIAGFLIGAKQAERPKEIKITHFGRCEAPND